MVFYEAHKVTQGLIEIGYMALCVHVCDGGWERFMRAGYRAYDHTKTGDFDIQPV